MQAVKVPFGRCDALKEQLSHAELPKRHLQHAVGETAQAEGVGGGCGRAAGGKEPHQAVEPGEAFGRGCIYEQRSMHVEG